MRKIAVLTIVGIALLACITDQTIVSSSDNPQSTSTNTKPNKEKREKLVSQAKKPKYTGIVKKADDIAEQITVRIDNLSEDSNGSGVIIAHQNDTYYVLTAKHVLCLSENDAECISNSRHQIVTFDGETHAIDPKAVEIPAEWLDLAVVSFKSKQTYQVATLGNYQLKDQWIFTSGFRNNKDGSEPQRILTGGTVFEKEVTDFQVKDAYSLEDGQGLVYTNISYQGMSGGAVLDSLGRVVGINTASEEQAEMTEEGQVILLNLGFSLGIPIIDFIGSADKALIKPQWLVLDGEITSKINQDEIKIIQQQLFVAKKLSDDSSYIDWINYGNQLWRYKKNTKAIEAFEKSILFSDNPHEAYYGIGLAYLDLGEYEQASFNLEKATELQPRIAYYWRWLGSSYKSLEKYIEAVLAYDNAIAIEKNIVFYVEKGDILNEQKKYSLAINSYSEALKIKKHPWCYTNRGNTYDNLGQYNKALDDYKQALNLNPELALAYYNRAIIYDNLKQYDKALDDLNLALIINPELVPAYNNRGITYDNLGQYDKALDDYTQAIALNPEFTEAYYNRGNTYDNLKQYDKALDDLNLALTINPEYVEAYNNRGNTYDNLGQYDKALDDYTQAIALNPQYLEAYLNRGFTHHALKQYKKAAFDYQQVLEINPNYFPALNYLGLIAYEQQQTDKAVEYWQQTLQLDRETEETILALAVGTYQQRKTDKAVDMATQVLSANQQLSNLDFLQGQLWGDRLIKDTQVLFKDERLQPLIHSLE